jgi:hypothetical protein
MGKRIAVLKNFKMNGGSSSAQQPVKCHEGEVRRISEGVVV